MVIVTDFAEAQIDALERYYDKRDRDLATVRMLEDVRRASTAIDLQTGPFLRAPRPYPELARLGWHWMRSGRYWLAFSVIPEGFAITAIFYERTDIPGQLSTLRRSLP